VVKFALSRSRELLADAGSVELTKNPDAMISALRKIENRGELPGATSAVMELCVDNPREGFADLFATHPSVDSRVQALVKFAGGHDPGRLALPSDRADGPEDRLPPPVAADQPLPRLDGVPGATPVHRVAPGVPTDDAEARISGQNGPGRPKTAPPLTTLRHDHPTAGLMN
jgi:heat shock protein HtpX